MVRVPQPKRKSSNIKPEVLVKALKATRCGVLITDPNQPDNPIVYANRAFCAMTGYSRDEILGRNCRFLQGKDRKQPELSAIREALRTKTSCSTILRNYKKSGEMFFNELSISPVFDKSGDLTHFVGIQKDVTAEVQLKTQRDEFLATLLHDIKTPLLASMRVLNHIKSNGSFTPAENVLVEGVMQNDYGLLRLIDNAMDCYRPEQLTAVHRTYYDLTKQLAKCAAQLMPAAQQKRVVLFMPDQPLVICADSRLCERVFFNLMELAIRYSPRVGRIKVKTDFTPDYFEVEFSNRSSGLPIKFFSAAQNLLLSFDDENSTALALHSARLILQQHGGELVLQRSNKVTSFIARLPANS
ncbi:MAG: PAS domain-containing protein [Candidatus Melainabacteria bacterium]|nr:MAG: PAS domain-containing protein [Candidatus Melainabacteria bacterium]